MNPHSHPAFTPTALSPEALERITVGREDLIARLARRVRDAATSATRAHTLVIGPRGSGKTHLLAIAVQRALADPEVRAAVAVAEVPEDSLAITSYADLLVELVDQLDPALRAEARKLRRNRDSIALEDLLIGAARGRVLVAVLENLNMIFKSIGTGGAGAFRGFVETRSSVLVLASAPQLFEGVSDRHQPWFGNFDIERLGDLSLDEGAELLRRRALDRGDEELALYVQSPAGRGRLEAIEHLAGGSPRLWHILADAASIESLEALVPAVEKLMDDLAPYYQQRLWELPPREQKLVVELARGDGARSVADLADAVDLQQNAAATLLGRLEDNRWVRKVNAPGTDKRRSWYELREPLLRHYLSYRESRGRPLRLIVSFLRVWFTPRERQRHLAGAVAGSRVEQLLADTFAGDGLRGFDSAWANRDMDELLAEVRCWRAGTSRSVVVGGRALADAVEQVVAEAQAAGGHGEDRTSVEDRVESGLVALARRSWEPRDSRIIRVLTACWGGHRNPKLAAAECARAMNEAEVGSAEALAFRCEHAFWTGEAGDAAGARDLFAALVAEYAQSRVLGPDHPDTLTARGHLASWRGQAGDPAGAATAFADLLDDRQRVLGPDHPDTLTARGHLARWRGQAGDPAGAAAATAALLADRLRVLGPDHPHTLAARGSLASWRGQAGDPAGAAATAALLADLLRVLGPDHPDTLAARHNLAAWTAAAGDRLRAKDLVAQLVRDIVAAPGLSATFVDEKLRSMLGFALRNDWPLDSYGFPSEALGRFVPDIARREVLPKERLVELLAVLDGEAEAFAILATQLALLVPDAQHIDWLAAFGEVPSVLTAFAKALDGDPVALVGLPPELRELVEAGPTKGPRRP